MSPTRSATDTGSGAESGVSKIMPAASPCPETWTTPQPDGSVHACRNVCRVVPYCRMRSSMSPPTRSRSRVRATRSRRRARAVVPLGRLKTARIRSRSVGERLASGGACPPSGQTWKVKVTRRSARSGRRQLWPRNGRRPRAAAGQGRMTSTVAVPRDARPVPRAAARPPTRRAAAPRQAPVAVGSRPSCASRCGRIGP